MTSSANPPGDEPIDTEVLDALVADVGDGDPALLADLIDSYLDEATGQVGDIDAAVPAGDAQRVARVAHSLKSASASLGATRLAAMLRDIEERAKRVENGTAEPAELAGPARDIKTEYARVADALTQLRPTG